MKKIAFYIFSLGLLTASFAVQTPAQQETGRNVSAGANAYVISAKAGGVNYVEGTVNVSRKAGRSGVLLKGDALEIGDVVATGADGKAEILLNPGSFVRLAGNSEFEFKTVALEDLQLKLKTGSAMFEVITDNEFTFAVNTPKAKFFVVKTGVYRVDILSDGTSKIEVWKGKAQVDDAYQTEVKGGREAVVNGSQVTVAKFDRDEKDEFEIFSKTRAKELAKVNKSLQNRAFESSLTRSFFNTRWSVYDSYGLWVFNRAFGSYAFLPFGYGWSSPYGYYYNCDLWGYNLPPVIYYYYPTNPTNPVNPTNPTNPTGPPPRVGDPGIRNPRVGGGGRGGDVVERVRPPYARIQNDIGISPVSTGVDSLPFPSSTVREGSTVRPPSSSSSVPTTVIAAPSVMQSPSAPPRKGN